MADNAIALDLEFVLIFEKFKWVRFNPFLLKKGGKKGPKSAIVHLIFGFIFDLST